MARGIRVSAGLELIDPLLIFEPTVTTYFHLTFVEIIKTEARWGNDQTRTRWEESSIFLFF
jgi:hypothetical protein